MNCKCKQLWCKLIVDQLFYWRSVGPVNILIGHSALQTRLADSAPAASLAAAATAGSQQPPHVASAQKGRESVLNPFKTRSTFLIYSKSNLAAKILLEISLDDAIFDQ